MLNVFHMKREDSRTYITDRVKHMLDIYQDVYRIYEHQVTHYRGFKFDQCMVFEHEDGMFKVIDWSDRDHPDKMESAEIIQHPQCQFVLKCQYNPRWRVPKLRPFFYFEKTDPLGFSNALVDLRWVPKTEERLYWRGNLHLGRAEILSKLEEYLNPDYKEMVPRMQYYEEIARHKFAISIPGLGKSCHREFECFGIGTVVISKEFQNTYYMPLMAGAHYICVKDYEPDTILDVLTGTSTNHMHWIRNRAMEYYDKYIRRSSSTLLLAHMLEL